MKTLMLHAHVGWLGVAVKTRSAGASFSRCAPLEVERENEAPAERVFPARRPNRHR